MSESGNKKVQKLEKVLQYYQQQMQVIQADCLRQNKIVLGLHLEISELENETELIYRQTERGEFLISIRLSAIGSLELNQERIRQKGIELSQGQAQLDECKCRVQEQMSKVESLEKLIDRKTDLLFHEKKRLDQGIADERYLSQHFTGRK